MEKTLEDWKRLQVAMLLGPLNRQSEISLARVLTLAVSINK